jgi:carboxylate-amine ligase
VKAGIIADSSYIWWAIRPSLAHPTLELRAPDCCTLIDDAIAIAALYRTLVRHLYYNPWRNHGMTAVSRALVVENKWRAQRYGIHGTFVTEEGAVTVGEMLERVIEETAADAKRPRLCRGDRPLPQDRGCGTSADASSRCSGAARRSNRKGAAGGDRLDRGATLR